MSKIFSTVSVVLMSASVFMFTAQPAFAEDSYVSDAVDGLSDSSVYVDSGASDLTNQDAIISILEGSDVNVAVLPPIAIDTYGVESIAGMIRQQTGDDTIVVVVEDTAGTKFGVSSVNNSTEIAKTLNEGLTANNGDAGQTLTATLQDVKSLSEGNTNSAISDGGGFNFAFILIPLLIVGAIGGGVVFMKRRKNYVGVANHNNVPTNAKLSELIPASLLPAMKQLNQLTGQHNALLKSSLAADIRSVIDNVQELFMRLNKKGTPSQQRIAEVEYADKLPKLIEALGDNYYIDIVKHPDLWDDSNERITAVTEAVKAVQQELILNIRKVNSSKDLEFQVALDSLVRSVHNPTINDIYNNKS